MLDELRRGLEGLAAPELAYGLAIGAVAVVARRLSPVVREHLGPGPVVGLAVAVALGSWWLFALAVVVSVVERWTPLPAVVVPVAATALAVRTPDGALVALAVVVVGLAAWRSHDGPPLPLTALAVLSAGGWYGGLPDTEVALAFLGAVAALLLAPPAHGWAAAWGVGGAVVVVGSAGRTGAMLGGLLCFGLLAVGRRNLLVHAVVVAYGARMVAVERDPQQAALLAVFGAAVVFVAWLRTARA